MAALEVEVEFYHDGLHISASALAREMTQITRIAYPNALLIVASEIRRRMQSTNSLWPKPPTPIWIQRQRTGVSHAGMAVHVVGRTVVVTNDVHYAPYVNYQRFFPTTGIPNWNYKAVERTLARDWLRIRNRSHRTARRRVLPPLQNVGQGSRLGVHGVNPTALFLPIIIWNREEEEDDSPVRR